MTKKAKEILKSFINEDTENDYFPTNPLEEKTRDEIKFVLKVIKNLEKELKQTKHNFKNSQTHSKKCYKKLYESLKKDYWELDKVEEDILQKFLLQGQVISAIQDEIVKKIENETIYEDVSPLCEVTISINKKIFDMLFEKKEVFEND